MTTTTRRQQYTAQAQALAAQAAAARPEDRRPLASEARRLVARADCTRFAGCYFGGGALSYPGFHVYDRRSNLLSNAKPPAHNRADFVSQRMIEVANVVFLYSAPDNQA